jgi:hypothetical protein
MALQPSARLAPATGGLDPTTRLDTRPVVAARTR